MKPSMRRQVKARRLARMEAKRKAMKAVAEFMALF